MAVVAVAVAAQVRQSLPPVAVDVAVGWKRRNRWWDVVVLKGLYIYWVVTKGAEEVSDYFFGSF